MTARNYWLDQLLKMASPVLRNAAKRELRKSMPVEFKKAPRPCTYLEAVGRLLAGIAPWLETGGGDPQRDEYAGLARRTIAALVDPASPDCVFPPLPEGTEPERQLLVDCAFLAHAMLRAPGELFEKLDGTTQDQLLAMLRRSRAIFPWANNWLLFSAMVETALLRFAGEGEMLRIDFALHMHDQWFKGDGIYGDGCFFAQDNYNSYVIHPMLLDIAAATENTRLEKFRKRSRRYAEIQERMIAPDGSFPAVGRSLAYRCGAFQLLGQMALHKNLPPALSEAQVRCAMQAVIARTLEAPGTYGEEGFLKIGLCGHQPSIGENYISTGSLYLASFAFLPLGLPAGDSFWTAPDEPWTARKVWGGADVPADHSVQD